MKQEDKQLLLKDICARLPYGVKVQNVLDNSIIDLKERLYCLPAALITNFKPYLRPMSSMTEGEKEELKQMALYQSIVSHHTPAMDLEFIDWYHSHHFDVRRLIEKGLALEAPEGIYKTE